MFRARLVLNFFGERKHRRDVTSGWMHSGRCITRLIKQTTVKVATWRPFEVTWHLSWRLTWGSAPESEQRRRRNVAPPADPASSERNLPRRCDPGRRRRSCDATLSSGRNPSIPAPVVGGPEPIRRLPAPPESAAGTARSIRRTDTTTRAGCRGFRRGANRQRCGAANSTNCPNWTPVAPSSTEDGASARRSHAVWPLIRSLCQKICQKIPQIGNSADANCRTTRQATDIQVNDTAHPNGSRDQLVRTRRRVESMKWRNISIGCRWTSFSRTAPPSAQHWRPAAAVSVYLAVLSCFISRIITADVISILISAISYRPYLKLSALLSSQLKFKYLLASRVFKDRLKFK